MDILIKNVKRAFELTRDLVGNLSDAQLGKKLENLPSNPIGDQFWCIIGARESYLEAMKNEKWMGFSCSLEHARSCVAIDTCLNKSEMNIIQFIEQNNLSDTQLSLLFDLHEHEIQHHGQLIRYMYANHIPFPKSWNNRYTV